MSRLNESSGLACRGPPIRSKELPQKPALRVDEMHPGQGHDRVGHRRPRTARIERLPSQGRFQKMHVRIGLIRRPGGLFPAALGQGEGGERRLNPGRHPPAFIHIDVGLHGGRGSQEDKGLIVERGRIVKVAACPGHTRSVETVFPSVGGLEPRQAPSNEPCIGVAPAPLRGEAEDIGLSGLDPRSPEVADLRAFSVERLGEAAVGVDAKGRP